MWRTCRDKLKTTAERPASLPNFGSLAIEMAPIIFRETKVEKIFIAKSGGFKKAD
jgi:hypothetical protein